MKKIKSIQFVKGIGPKKAELFEKLGIFTNNDLLHFYPKSYEIWTDISDICDTKVGEINCVKAKLISKPTVHRINGGKTICKTVIADDTGILTVTFFNNKFIPQMLHLDTEYVFRGKISNNYGGKELLSPEFFTTDKSPTIRPIYRQTSGITSKQISNTVKSIISDCQTNDSNLLEESLPFEICKKYRLCSLKQALYMIHFPKNLDEVDVARKRLIFEEFLILQLGMKMMRHRNKSFTSYCLKEDYFENFKELLPFTLTNAQDKAVQKCLSIAKKNTPMNVLLQGDVGSGKTAVAGALCHSFAKNNIQSALMAPTEILAKQHYNSLSSLLSSENVRVELLTGNVTGKKRKDVYERLEKGEIDLLIGTHAIISESVKFKNLGFVITDEQHRFGVKQRTALAKKGESPHTLVMSATPIPRTLALMIYGDLDMVILDELPAGRQKIETYAINSPKRERAFGYIQKHLDNGKQAYIICPLIEQSDSDLASIESYFEFLQKYFPKDIIAVLHGKMKGQEKEEVMETFSKNQKQILLSTTVVEVGVDVPNAVIMLIENSERYGLSQLHQLRGRVGRGKDKSTCILVTDTQSKDSLTRLKFFCKSMDGFQIADEDLKMRGPGDFFGEKQHGLPSLKIANIAQNIDVLREAGLCSEELLHNDSKLENYLNIQNSINELFATGENLN